ncbi:hypothetical protein D3C75_1130400 [compost metagenome]
MGLLDLHLVVRVRLLPVLDELGVVLLVQLPGRIVGHVQQLVVLGDGGTGKHGAGECSQGITADGHGEAPDWLFFLIRLSAGLVAGVLQAELFLAFDLHHLGVVHGDFHRAVTQAIEGIVDLAQQAGFILSGNTA